MCSDPVGRDTTKMTYSMHKSEFDRRYNNHGGTGFTSESLVFR